MYVTLRRKTDLFHDQMEPESAERRLRRLKKFLLLAGISLAASVPAVLYALIAAPSEESVAGGVIFFILLLSLVLFFVGTVVGWVIYLNGRKGDPAG